MHQDFEKLASAECLRTRRKNYAVYSVFEQKVCRIGSDDERALDYSRASHQVRRIET